MFGEKYILVSAVLMTMATLAWGFTLYFAVQTTGGWPIMNVIVFLTFAALAVIYWMMYSRRKNAQTSIQNPIQTSGTE